MAYQNLFTGIHLHCKRRTQRTAMTIKQAKKKSSFGGCALESLQCLLKGLVILGQNMTLGSKFSIVRLLADVPQKKKEKGCFEKMCDGHLVFNHLMVGQTYTVKRKLTFRELALYQSEGSLKFPRKHFVWVI